MDLINPSMTYFAASDNTFTLPLNDTSDKTASALVVLDLTRTGQSGYFPTHRFPMLSVLKLAQNRWSSDISLSQVQQSISQLDLSQNQFSMASSALSNLPLLTNLDAHSNRIYGSVVLSGLPNLHTVNLADNLLNYALDLNAIGDAFLTSSLKQLNISKNPRISARRYSASSGLTKTSSSSPSIAYPKSVTCYELSFFNKTSGTFIYDEAVFEYEQCDCNQDYFGLPPTNCRKCPTDGTLSCGATQVTISNTSYGFTYIPSSSSTPSTLPQSPHSQQVSISSIFASLTSTFGLGYYDDVISNINAIGTTHEIETESCLVTTIQTLSSSSNCRGVQITSSDLVGTHVSLESLLKPQCAEGSDGRLCSRCICDVAKEGSSPSCWFSSGPTCSKCRRVFPLSTSLPLVLSMMVLLIVVMSIVIGIVLHRKRRQSLKSFSNLALPKRIFYRVMHLTTLGNVSIVVTFLQMLIGITQWDVYARVSILGVLNGGGEGYDSTFSIFSLL